MQYHATLKSYAIALLQEMWSLTLFPSSTPSHILSSLQITAGEGCAVSGPLAHQGIFIGFPKGTAVGSLF